MLNKIAMGLFLVVFLLELSGIIDGIQAKNFQIVLAYSISAFLTVFIFILSKK